MVSKGHGDTSRNDLSYEIYSYIAVNVEGNYDSFSTTPITSVQQKWFGSLEISWDLSVRWYEAVKKI